MTANTVAEALIKRTDENFKSREQLSQARLEAQLKPVAETLAKFEAQVTAVEKARAEETGGLKAQIAALMEASTATQFEARKLSAALRRGAGVQGRWGEQTLRNVLEAAGLNNRFDFEEQFSVDTEEGRRRPDVKVKMPGGGVFVIDAKCSLNAFLDAQEATDEPLREAAMIRHAASVRAHMQGCRPRAIGTSSPARARPTSWPCSCPATASWPRRWTAARPDGRGHGPPGAAGHPDHPVRPVQGRRLWLAGRGPGQERRRHRRGRPRALQAHRVMGAHAGSVGKALEAAVAATTSSSARWKARS
jgi:DNA recombination protein RmuC